MKRKWGERILTAGVLAFFLTQFLSAGLAGGVFLPGEAGGIKEKEERSLETFLVKAAFFQVPLLSYLEKEAAASPETGAQASGEEAKGGDDEITSGMPEDEEIHEEGVEEAERASGQWSDPEDQFDYLEPEAAKAIPAEVPVKDAMLQVYAKEQLEDFSFLTSQLYKVSTVTKITPEELPVSKMLSQDFSIDLSASGPKILIFHTHGTEDFADTIPGDTSTNIVGVGEQLAQNLREIYGIEVLHDTTVFPYKTSYSMAREHVAKLLTEYPSIQVVIDLHRDAPGTEKQTVEINGVTMSRIMFFNGLCQDQDGKPFEGLENPNRFANLSFSLQMKLLADAYYPGLAKRNFLKGQRYNMHLMPRYLLIEAGDQKNTVQEEKNAMGPLAEILYHVLSGK